MRRTNSQRVREWREKKSKEGGRSLSVWMGPETARKLHEIKDRSGEATSSLVTRAIEALHAVTCNTGDTIPAPLPAEASSGKGSQKAGGEIPRAADLQDRGAADVTTITCNITETAPGESRTAVIGDSLASIKALYREKGNFPDIRERLAALLRLRIEEGEPYSALMKELNDAEVPTPEGEDAWRRGTIFTLLR
jgi:hypothetical protein